MTTIQHDDRATHVERHGLRVARELVAFVEEEALPGTGIAAAELWSSLAALLRDLTPVNRDLLERRNELQREIDGWLADRRDQLVDAAAQRSFLEEIGYIVPTGPAFSVETTGVADEVAALAGPQLVVPVDNARYAINAVNARWGSLYDAVYGTDVLGDVAAPGPYDTTRGARVIAWVRNVLDEIVPLAAGSHHNARCYRIDLSGPTGALVVDLDGCTTVGLRDPAALAGWSGDAHAPARVLLRHHGLGIELVIDREDSVGATDLAGLADIFLESALTVIMDCEDSVAAVDGADKAAVYRNWLGLARGTLTAEVAKGDRMFTRTLAPDRAYLSPGGAPLSVAGRALALARVVGHRMSTPAVLGEDGEAVPEGLLDALMVALGSLVPSSNPGEPATRPAALYIVKPKMHGPDEVAFAVETFARVERALGMASDTIKIGIMDEERRTTVNLAECIRQARRRVVFINTGFLDRTGDEIHTAMEAGAVVRKADMKREPWILAYEDWNVDVGLACGLAGRGQIGKGMWAMPDAMASMLEQKIAHPAAGASCAWVPSPTAATLHALHYHRVDVAARQRELFARLGERGPRATLEQLLQLPIAAKAPMPEDVIREVENNVQGILGYVVRWVDQGVGCSKVPDIDDVALMEDRATCRISSQHVANWLRHGVVSAEQVDAVFQRMAAVVDRQNAGDAAYDPMAPACDGTAYKAARELVFGGAAQGSGYTEPVLHAARARRKTDDAASRAATEGSPT